MLIVACFLKFSNYNTLCGRVAIAMRLLLVQALGVAASSFLFLFLVPVIFLADWRTDELTSWLSDWRWTRVGAISGCIVFLFLCLWSSASAADNDNNSKVDSQRERERKRETNYTTTYWKLTLESILTFVLNRQQTLTLTLTSAPSPNWIQQRLQRLN